MWPRPRDASQPTSLVLGLDLDLKAEIISLRQFILDSYLCIVIAAWICDLTRRQNAAGPETQETYIIHVLNYSVELTVIHCRVHFDRDGPWFSPRDGKEHLLLWFSSVWVVANVRVQFSASSLQAQRQFGFCSSSVLIFFVLSSVTFCSVRVRRLDSFNFSLLKRLIQNCYMIFTAMCKQIA